MKLEEALNTQSPSLALQRAAHAEICRLRSVCYELYMAIGAIELGVPYDETDLRVLMERALAASNGALPAVPPSLLPWPK